MEDRSSYVFVLFMIIFSFSIFMAFAIIFMAFEIVSLHNIAFKNTIER